MTRQLLITLIGLVLSCCNNNSSTTKKTHDKYINGISIIDYSVIRTFPHSTDSYTEGFLFHDNKLYESTGSPENFPNTRSVIGIVNLKTGNIDVKIEIDRNKYFGEGILFFNDKLYQLTYKNQLGFIYDSKDFKQVGTFTYANKEGWGMTTDGKSIIMSDGTNLITYWDPDSLKEIKKINITYNGASALYANELEYINGFIYANIWTTNYIAKIDPGDGKIVGLIDLTSLFLKARKENPMSEATNGIAYEEKKDKIFVTGKLWPYIFEIKFQH
jgi:glutamine cyclotransferase